MSSYPVRQLFYEPWKDPVGYVERIRQALGGMRVTADELELVLADVLANRERLAPAARWMRRNVWLRRFLAISVLGVTFIGVARGFPRFDASFSPLLAVGAAVVLAVFAVMGFIEWLSARHHLPINLKHCPEFFTGAEQDPLRWDRAFRDADRMLRADIRHRREWESEGPPAGYGEDLHVHNHHS